MERLRYQVYSTTAPGGSGSELIAASLYCSTASDKIAQQAASEAVQRIGKALVVIVLEDGQVKEVLRGGTEQSAK